VIAVANRPALRWACAAVAAIVVLLGGCGRARPARWGESVDSPNVVPLSRALEDYDSLSQRDVTVSGRITDVCKSSGCWFVLQDFSKGHDYQLYVDLTHGATFTVPPDVQGRLVVVKGRIVGQKPDLKLYAVGLRISG
jgi:hypothetical protein